jgi:hypothetical protein
VPLLVVHSLPIFVLDINMLDAGPGLTCYYRRELSENIKMCLKHKAFCNASRLTGYYRRWEEHDATPASLHRYETDAKWTWTSSETYSKRLPYSIRVTTTARSLKHFGLSVALHRKRRINSA